MSTMSAKFLLFAALLLLVLMPNSAASEEEGVKCCKGSMIQKWIKISDQISKRFEELSLRFPPLAVCMKYVFRPLGKLWNYLLRTVKPAAPIAAKLETEETAQKVEKVNEEDLRKQEESEATVRAQAEARQEQEKSVETDTANEEAASVISTEEAKTVPETSAQGAPTADSNQDGVKVEQEKAEEPAQQTAAE
ncbi:hypothetical protein GUITHDRAFT_160853 [Guillardia theta CCMP2712]|uniref:Uncharacterized protein n=1 Tax=Guillardia theta (strain CCMP2712) TaxID=905079 RepID=L1K068_GUITC|nr:hypothetical protein GUITHDRAFT_160853 [Guillardia theta CCMP2712]EKX54251.1 hypothetical protein GUITHDRAFT_160853 [Guillardia theta CCMP2712]|eukprot:XP_005841231.1 hypothetical protein GUITHDRAFT_160853 [Guillardia theta CCMP2712]